MRSLRDLYRWCREDAEKRLRRLESGDEFVPKVTPDGELMDGTDEQMAVLRDTIQQLEQAMRRSELH